MNDKKTYATVQKFGFGLVLTKAALIWSKIQ